ncbi:MAG: ROK family protein, partial [Micromonosporaceae bacterium]
MKHLAGSSRLLRAINETAALGHLLDRGPLTRGDLRALTGLAKPTTSEVLRRLREAGLAIVVGRTSGGPGPNAELYAINPDAAYVAAVSVREHDAAFVTAICDLTGVLRAQVETGGRDADPVRAVADAVQAACHEAGIPESRLDHVQLGVPGSYDERADMIRYVDVPGWSRPGLIGQIRERLGVPVSVDNDVNLAAIAERRHGIAVDHDNFALLWLGEQGLGLAIVLNGTVLRGVRGGAGEIGYMPVGLPVPGGGGGAEVADFQDLVGGDAVRELARQYGFPARPGQDVSTGHGISTGHGAKAGDDASASTGHDAVASAVAALTRTDPTPVDQAGGALESGSRATDAQAFLEALAVRIAVGVAAVVAILDPPLVVLGGEVGRAGGHALRDAVSTALGALSCLATIVETTSLAAAGGSGPGPTGNQRTPEPADDGAPGSRLAPGTAAGTSSRSAPSTDD